HRSLHDALPISNSQAFDLKENGMWRGRPSGQHADGAASGGRVPSRRPLNCADTCRSLSPMCGIVGAIANRDVVPVLIEGLKRLEYRGYDSAGIAVLDGADVRRVRRTGRVSEM